MAVSEAATADIFFVRCSDGSRIPPKSEIRQHFRRRKSHRADNASTKIIMNFFVGCSELLLVVVAVAVAVAVGVVVVVVAVGVVVEVEGRLLAWVDMLKQRCW